MFTHTLDLTRSSSSFRLLRAWLLTRLLQEMGFQRMAQRIRKLERGENLVENGRDARH